MWEELKAKFLALPKKKQILVGFAGVIIVLAILSAVF